MPDFNVNDCFEVKNPEVKPFDEGLVVEYDVLMEQILKNINTTPIGQVLRTIAELPEIRKEKVLDIRQQLNRGKYSLNNRLDVAIDKVLEESTVLKKG